MNILRLVFVGLIGVALLGASRPATAQPQNDALLEARTHYNEGRLDEAIAVAAGAGLDAALEPAARLVEGRARLERYRRDRDESDLEAGRRALLRADPTRLDERERTELLVGLAEALFLEEAFGAAAELFDGVLDSAAALDRATRERVLDWWATALDRQAQTSAPDEAASTTYDRLVGRMEDELRRDPTSGVASYWLAVSARAGGDLDRAWHAAIAGWVRAPLTVDRGAALRADLDQLLREGVIPDRARRLAAADLDAADDEEELEKKVQAAETALEAEWEEIKARWTSRPD